MQVEELVTLVSAFAGFAAGLVFQQKEIAAACFGVAVLSMTVLIFQTPK